MSQQIIYFHFINLFNHKFYDDYYYNLSSYSAKVLVIFQKKALYTFALNYGVQRWPNFGQGKQTSKSCTSY